MYAGMIREYILYNIIYMHGTVITQQYYGVFFAILPCERDWLTRDISKIHKVTLNSCDIIT